jgi:hypothetical protein
MARAWEGTKSALSALSLGVGVGSAHSLHVRPDLPRGYLSIHRMRLRLGAVEQLFVRKSIVIGWVGVAGLNFESMMCMIRRYRDGPPPTTRYRAFFDALPRGEGRSIRVDEFGHDRSIKAYLDGAIAVVSHLLAHL